MIFIFEGRFQLFIISDLTDEQKEIQELARKFSREEIVPKAAEYDRTMEYPWEIVKKVCKIICN